MTQGRSGQSAVSRQRSSSDLISYGALFPANPDPPARPKAGGPFDTPDPSTFFGDDAQGYPDYPALDAV